jgi:hypothetical protein
MLRSTSRNAVNAVPLGLTNRLVTAVSSIPMADVGFGAERVARAGSVDALTSNDFSSHPTTSVATSGGSDHAKSSLAARPGFAPLRD